MQIKISLLLCFIGLTLFSSAQHNDVYKNNKWSFGLFFSPSYAYRSVTVSDNSLQWMADLNNEADKPKTGYSTGLSILYRLNKPIELETGVLYSNKGFRFEFDEFVTPESQPDPSIPENASTTYSYRYLTIPVKTNWFFLDRKLKLYMTGGLSGNFFLDAVHKSELEFEDRVEKHSYHDDASHYKKFHVDVLAGLGAEIPVLKRLNLRVEPHYRRAVTSMTDSSIKLYCWSAGVKTAIYFRL